jgi:hypothetical protein
MTSAVRVFGFCSLVSVVSACGRSGLPGELEGSTGVGGGPVAVAGVAGAPAAQPAVCGNGRIETGEQCDRTTLGSSTCATLGFNGGQLRCARACQYDTSGCVAKAPPVTLPPTMDRCANPDSPIALTRACIDQLCSCDRPAFSRCDFACWARVACQVATCNNNPSRKECATGCTDSNADELSLGRCYEDSAVCTRR